MLKKRIINEMILNHWHEMRIQRVESKNNYGRDCERDTNRVNRKPQRPFTISEKKSVLHVA